MKMEKTTSDREKQSMCETVNRTQSNLDNVQRKKDELDREVVEIKRKISELTNLHQTLRQEKDNFETQYKQAKDKVHPLYLPNYFLDPAIVFWILNLKVTHFVELFLRNKITLKARYTILTLNLYK